MTPATLLSDLTARGVEFRAQGDKLRFCPVERLTADEVEFTVAGDVTVTARWRCYEGHHQASDAERRAGDEGLAQLRVFALGALNDQLAAAARDLSELATVKRPAHDCMQRAARYVAEGDECMRNGYLASACAWWRRAGENYELALRMLDTQERNRQRFNRRSKP